MQMQIKKNVAFIIYLKQLNNNQKIELRRRCNSTEK